MSGIAIGIIIQARMGSTRLPGKILMPIGGRTLLGHISHRLSRLRTKPVPVFATSLEKRDDAVEEFCRAQGILCYRGSEADVLDRYYRCAQHFHFRHVVRLTGDNPFPDMEELERLIALHLAEGAHFSHSFETLPLGVGAEIFTMEALEESWLHGKAPHHREHVDEYLLENPLRFKTARLSPVPSKARPAVRLTVDTEEDYRRACFIVARSGQEYVTTEEAIALAERFDAGEGQG